MVVLLNQLIIIFATLSLIRQVFCCSVNYFNEAWVDDWSVLLNHSTKNQYQLFRAQNVGANKDIVSVCNNKRRPVTVVCNADQQFNATLPVPNMCPENESLQPVRITEETSYCPYTLYKIGFNVAIDGRMQFHETYRVCFDNKHMRTLFTINKVYPVGGGRPSSLKFNADDIFSGRYFSAYTRRSTFDRFRILLGNDQQYMSASNIDHIIDRGHLTPSADFTLTNLKRSTFNMINIMPQFKTIDNGNWRRIEEWTRQRSRTPATACTGVLNCNLDASNPAELNCVVQLQDTRGRWVPMFLADDRKIPIPLWSYKIVKNPQAALVFLTLNNIYHKGDVPVPHNRCKEIECPFKLSQTVKEGRTFCCDYDDFISRNVPYLRGVC